MDLILVFLIAAAAATKASACFMARYSHGRGERLLSGKEGPKQGHPRGAAWLRGTGCVLQASRGRSHNAQGQTRRQYPEHHPRAQAVGSRSAVVARFASALRLAQRASRVLYALPLLAPSTAPLRWRRQ